MPLTKLVKGDDWRFEGTVYDSAGNLQNIAGGSAWVTFKTVANIGLPDSSASFQVKNINIQDSNDAGNDVANGVVVLRAAWNTAGSPPDNSNIAVGSYHYDFQYKNSGGEITTIDSGTVTIVEQTTEDTA